MDDPRDPTPGQYLEYHKADEPQQWSMVGLAQVVGWCSMGLSLLLFVDPYLPELHVLMLLPLAGAAAGIVLAVLAAQKHDHRRAAMVALIPNLLAILIPTLSMLSRWLLPHRMR